MTMQSRCCLIFLSALGILVSAQRTTTPPTTTSTQPEGSSPTPSTCAVVVNTCSDDQGCKELLTNFNHRCWRAMHHGHRKQCPQSCADALDALINHTKGAAFATCNCGEDLLCNRRRQYLKRACQLRPGTHNPPHKQHCREAIAICLLDSCCRKAYMEFYYGEECESVLTFLGLGPEPSCSDACVAKFDKLAESPFAEGLFLCDCNDFGTVCTKRYDNYDKFCIDKRFNKSSEDEAERSDYSTLSFPNSVASTILNCLLVPKCKAAFTSFSTECKAVVFYLDDGPRPVCTAACAAKADALLQQIGTGRSKLQENLMEHCFQPKTYDCRMASQQCVTDPACLTVLLQYLYGNECRNVLEYDGHSSPEPNCSTACIERERALRIQPKAQALLYCNCPADSPNNCSQRRENFNRFCNVCPDNYNLPVAPTSTVDELVSETTDAILCANAEDHCKKDTDCGTRLLHLVERTCHHILQFTGNGTPPVCNEPCQKAYKSLSSHPRGKLVVSCNCGADSKCSFGQSNFFKYCPVKKRPLSCTDIGRICRDDEECDKLLTDFTALCREVLLFTGNGAESRRPVCGLPCLLAQGNLISHPVGQQLTECHCGAAPNCSVARANIRRFCAIPANPEYPKGNHANSTCEVTVHKCLQDPGCRSVMTSVANEPACSRVSHLNQNVQEDCKNCLKQMTSLAGHGIDLTRCTCAMHSCKVRRETIKAVCLSKQQQPSDQG